MPKGRLLRQDDATRDSLKIAGQKNLDDEMLKALTAEEGGPLAAGVLPHVKTATEAGGRKLMQALDDDRSTVVKPKKVKPPKATEEEVVPKTPLQSGPQQILLEQFHMVVYTYTYMYTYVDTYKDTV